MVMINQFDLIGDTDVDDPLQIALAQIEIMKKKAAVAAALAEAAAVAKAEAAAAAAAAKAKAEAAAAAAAAKAKAEAAATADLELPLEETETETETEKGILAVPPGSVAYQGRRGQNGHGRNSGWNFENNRNGDGFFAVANSRGKGSGRNRNGDGYSVVAEDSTHELLGKPSIRRHSDQQPYHSRGGGGGGRGRGYLNRDNGEYADQPSRRQRRSGYSSPSAKVKGELAPLVKDVPVPHVELGTMPEQNLEENATLEGKSLSIPKETVELDNAPSSNALNKDKEGMANGRKEKEPEVKVIMTLGEYQKVLEKNRKTAVKKTQERKIDVDKEFESMQQLVVKKENNEFFIKLGNDKEARKRKEDTDGDERVKKDTNGDESGVKKHTDRVESVKRSVIGMFEYLRLAEGRRGGRGGRGGDRDGQGGRGDPDGQGGRGDRDGQGGRGDRDGQGGRGDHGGQGGRGGRGGQGGRGGRGYSNSFSDESIKDPSNSFSDESMKNSRQFPALGGKEVEQQHSSGQWKKVEQQQQHSSAQGRK